MINEVVDSDYLIHVKKYTIFYSFNVCFQIVCLVAKNTKKRQGCLENLNLNNNLSSHE